MAGKDEEESFMSLEDEEPKSKKPKKAKKPKQKQQSKPKAQTKEPIRNPKRKTKKWFGEVKNWGINQAKWKSAEEYCKDQGMEFKIFTEVHLIIV